MLPFCSVSDRVRMSSSDACDPGHLILPAAYARRRLAHFDYPCAVQHVVFRLADSLPAKLLNELDRHAPSERIDAAEAALDAGIGSRALARPVAAAEMIKALRYFDGQRYALAAWCVMPTHVHVLVEQAEGWPFPHVVHGWKSFTAKAINRALGWNVPFWARNYFDRYMCSDEQLDTTRTYIEDNPVKARLCGVARDWPWSSAADG